MRRAVGALIVAGALLAARQIAHAKGCHETSYVVGVEHCGHFGSWSPDDTDPRIWLDIGYFDRHLASDAFTLAATPLAAHAPALATTMTGGLLRILGHLTHRIYVGGEGELGTPGVAGLDRAPTVATAEVIHAVIGVHLTAVRFGLGAELAAGGRFEQFSYCPTTSCMEVDASQAHLDLVARGRVDVYFSPLGSLGIAIGHSVTVRDGAELVVVLSLHVRPMDGL